MRESNPNPIKNNDADICAIILEASYCAEQEHGIKAIQEKLGIVPPEAMQPKDYAGPWGIDRATVTKFELTQNQCQLIEQKETRNCFGLTLLYFNLGYYSQKLESDLRKLGGNGWFRGNSVESSKKKVQDTSDKNKALELSGARYLHSNASSSAAWCDDGFAILSRDAETAVFLKRVFSALTGKGEKVAIWLGGVDQNPFARCGLVIGLPDLIDAESHQKMSDVEKERHKLYWMAEDTGIPKLIPKSKYHALSPGLTINNRVSYGEFPETFTTKYPIMFFLNPTEQDKNNSGWFTVEELQAWMQGEPPITKPEWSKRLKEAKQAQELLNTKNSPTNLDLY